MPTLPAFDPSTKVNRSPHVVILGAGASKAAIPGGDVNGKIAPVLNELAEVTGINPILARLGLSQSPDNFEMIYDDLATSGSHPSEQVEIERAIHTYFHQLRLPVTPTAYDYLVLALRRKDVVATFNWDPLLLQAYRRNAAVGELPTILHLHGNAGVGLCLRDGIAGVLGEACRKCGRPLEPSRLLYPVHHKDYTQDPFIQSEWARLRDVLTRAYFLTVFGYAAPETDVEARSLLLGAWSGNRSFELAQVNIIDILPEAAIEARWSDFFCRAHFGVYADAFESWLFRYPRRSCDALASFTLDNRSWADTPFPRFTSLSDLHAWIQPLLAEERQGRFSGRRWDELSRG
jgi:hypothetical protein